MFPFNFDCLSGFTSLSFRPVFFTHHLHRVQMSNQILIVYERKNIQAVNVFTLMIVASYLFLFFRICHFTEIYSHIASTACLEFKRHLNAFALEAQTEEYHKRWYLNRFVYPSLLCNRTSAGLPSVAPILIAIHVACYS